MILVAPRSVNTGSNRERGWACEKNERQDDTYYIARRRSTTWRNKSRPLGFGWGGERGNGVDWRVNTRRDCRYYIAIEGQTQL